MRLMILWGIGNHGGGPSRVDLERIAEWTEKNRDKYTVIHSTPERYFAGLDTSSLQYINTDLTPIMVGCYSSQRRVKQLHSELESALFQTEKLCCAAKVQTGVPIPYDALAKTEETLLFNEFHDILPGSGIRQVENAAVQAMGGAIEDLKKLRTHAFMKLAADIPAPPEDTIPILLYNPHPWTVDTVTDADFMLQDQNWEPYWLDYDVYDGDSLISSQLVKENSNVPLDWSKQLALEVTLPPFTMKQLIARPKKLAQKPQIKQPAGDAFILTFLRT